MHVVESNNLHNHFAIYMYIPIHTQSDCASDYKILFNVMGVVLCMCMVTSVGLSL